MPIRRWLVGAVVLVALLAAAQSGAAQSEAPTFSGDIAPLVFARCAACHHPGGAGPFSLLTYQDVVARARQIAEVTRSRFMPPWLPEPGHGRFRGERRLSDREIGLIEAWVAAGAPEGDPVATPPAPTWPDGWQLGSPDLVIRMPEPFVLPAAGDDVFRNFAIPIPVDEARYVRAVEFRPDNLSLVHHARMLVDRTGESRSLAQQDPAPGYDGMLVDAGEFPDGHFLGWSPGKLPSAGDDELAWRLEPDTDLVAQLHMLPTGKPESIQVSVGFFWADGPPRRSPIVLTLGSKTIDIPANESNYAIADSYELPVDVEVLRVYPHAHYLAERMESLATLVDGTTVPLIRIGAWDFNWQDEYEYAQPVHLPAGSTISMRYTYDNSSANVRNPNEPPKRVVYGSQSVDEMGELLFQLLPASPGDAALLESSVARKILDTDIAGYEKLLRDDPTNGEVHNALSFLYQRAGQPGRALEGLRQAVEVDPGYAMGHYNLGVMLWERGARDEAIASLRHAVDADSSYAEAHNNLGVMLQSTGRVAEGVAHYRLAIRLNPDYALPHGNLASVYRSRGHLDAAAGEYREALRIRSDYPEAHSGLGLVLSGQGRAVEALDHLRMASAALPESVETLVALSWILATHADAAVRDPAAAVTLATRADRLARGRDPLVLNALAAAHAASGDTGRAVAMAEEALAVALRDGSDGLADRIRDVLEIYREGRPFIQPEP